LVNEKRKQLDRIIADCLGLTVGTIGPWHVVPGETLDLTHTAFLSSETVPVRWVTTRYPDGDLESTEPVELTAQVHAMRHGVRRMPPATPPTQPYWLRQEPAAGIYRVDDPTLIGMPENRPVYPIEQVFEIAGQTLVLQDAPFAATSKMTRRPPGDDSVGWWEDWRRLTVIAPITVVPASDVRLFVPGASRSVDVELTAPRADTRGTLRLDVPDGWQVRPVTQPFELPRVGNRVRLTFEVTAPSHPASANITAWANVGGMDYSNQWFDIRYDHIPPQLLQPASRVKAVALDLKKRGTTVGYIPGAGDSVAQSIEQMGYTVKTLGNADLTTAGLRGLDAVVVGVRAFDADRELIGHMPALFDYAWAGGNVIVQYNRVDGLTDTPLTLRISSGNRVTDETAPVTFLAPDHPVLNTPNKITAADFDGWVQERSTYCPVQWDERFTPILASNDPGEEPIRSQLLVAKYGQGYFTYATLVFFRELPAGVPGTYRLFANLLSLGKE
jgi:hypothetical protein